LAQLDPRKQATQARAARTVEAILEAAARILEDRGLEGYTTNAIAGRAGVSIGSLYQYFPNKDAITLALIARETAELLAELRAAAAEPDWREGLKAMVRAGVAHQLRRPRLARLLDIEEARLPNPAHQDRVATVAHAAIVAVLERAPMASDEDVATLAFDIMAVTRAITDAAGARGEWDAQSLERRVLRAVSGCLGLGAVS
jgi:AcrR family transcriptional regulator